MSSPKEKFYQNIVGVHIVDDKLHIPVVSSNGLTYVNVVSIPAKKHKYI
jgi:hypothetical protein